MQKLYVVVGLLSLVSAAPAAFADDTVAAAPSQGCQVILPLLFARSEIPSSLIEGLAAKGYSAVHLSLSGIQSVQDRRAILMTMLDPERYKLPSTYVSQFADSLVISAGAGSPDGGYCVQESSSISFFGNSRSSSSITCRQNLTAYQYDAQGNVRVLAKGNFAQTVQTADVNVAKKALFDSLLAQVPKCSPSIQASPAPVEKPAGDAATPASDLPAEGSVSSGSAQ